ncbi:hypothetical protein SALBM135S_09199 [Streptomyces alboniger]
MDVDEHGRRSRSPGALGSRPGRETLRGPAAAVLPPAVPTSLLRAHGAGLGDTINLRTFLTDIGTPPTSTTVEVPRLFRSEALIEVEVVAAVPAGRAAAGSVTQ